MITSASRSLRAILFAIMGFTGWVLCDTVNKFNVEHGASKFVMMVLGSLSGLLTVVTWVAVRGQLSKYKVRHPLRMLGYSCLMPFNFYLVITSLEHLPLTMVYAVSFLAPLCVSFAASVILKERMTKGKIIAIAAGFIGVLIAIDPVALYVGHASGFGIMIALISVVVFTTQSLLMRSMSKDESQESMVTYPRFMAMLGGLLALAFHGFSVPTLPSAGAMVLTGILGSFSWLLIAYAYKMAPAATVAPFHYSQIISGAILGYIVWNDVPSFHLLLGVAIIILSGLYIVWHTKTTVIEAEDKASGR